ncbi:MAG: hypothetical protein JWM11_6724 [Planctomycetaceae bacterium]|nr:hypothetical protein [Planctomycetaceae bacterium]
MSQIKQHWSTDLAVSAIKAGCIAMSIAWIPFWRFLSLPIICFGIVIGAISIGVALCRKGREFGFGLFGMIISTVGFLVFWFVGGPATRIGIAVWGR